jgi:hypothetical protein
LGGAAAAGVLRCGDDRPGIAAGACGAGRRQSDGGRTTAAPSRHTAPSRHSGPPCGAWSPWSARSSTRGGGLGLLGGGGELNRGATGLGVEGSRPDRSLPQESCRADQSQGNQAGQKRHRLEGAEHPRARLQRIVFLPRGPVFFLSLVFGPPARKT